MMSVYGSLKILLVFSDNEGQVWIYFMSVKLVQSHHDVAVPLRQLDVQVLCESCDSNE